MKQNRLMWLAFFFLGIAFLCDSKAETIIGPLLTDVRKGVCVYTSGAYDSTGLVPITTHLTVGHPDFGRYRAFYQWSLPDNVVPDGARITRARLEFSYLVISGGATMIAPNFTKIESDLNSTPARTLFNSIDDNSIPHLAANQGENGRYQQDFTEGSPLISWLTSQLPTNRFTIGVCVSTELLYPYYYQLYSHTIKLTIWVASQEVAADQVFENSNRVANSSVGHYEGSAFVPYGVPHPFTFEVNNTETMRADTNLWTNPSSGNPEKYRTWNTMGDVVNHKDFLILPGLTRLESQFKPPTYATIEGQLLEGGDPGGTIDFKDPWLIDTSDAKGPKNRGANARWRNYSSPFHITVSDPWYKGVFIGQDPSQTPSYYSVNAPDLDTINNSTAYFMGWGGTNVTFQNSSSHQTGIVFTASGATATAKYKAHLASNSSAVLDGNGQRKVVSDTYGGYHMVYPSAGSIWYSYSGNGGATWSPEKQLNLSMDPAAGLLNRLPSIAFIPGTTYSNSSVMVVWEGYDAQETSRALCYCELALTGQIIQRNENFYLSNTTGQGSAPGIGVGRTGDQFHGFTYYPLIVWFCPEYSGWLAVTRAGGNWYDRQFSGLTNASEFSVAPFCYRGYRSPEWDVAYVLNNTLYYAPISGVPPTLGTPQIVVAGGSSRDVKKPSIYVVGGNTEPVSGEPAIAWEQSQPTNAIGFSKRTGSSWDHPAYFTHHGHVPTNPALGVYCDAGTGSLFIDLLWQCGNHVARVSRPMQNPLWSSIVDLGTGGAPAICATLLPTGPTVRANVTSSGQLFVINTSALTAPQLEQWGANWNIAGIAVRVPDYSPTAVFATAVPPVYKYECEGYVTVPARCDSNRGFWTKFPTTQPNWPIGYTGTFIDSMSMPVRNCWNMIGSISVPVETSSVRYYPPGIRASSFFKYSSSTGYVAVSELNPGLGFWVKSSQNGYMVLQNSPISTIPIGISPPQDQFIVTDNAGHRQALFVVNAASEGAASIEMPPPPPEFDARWEPGNIQMSIDPSGGPVELPIILSNVAYPITLEWTLNPGTGLEYALPEGGGLPKAGSGNPGRGSMTISSHTNRIVLLGSKKGNGKPGELPSVLALHQNYPNPFNPTTTIRFDLPEAANVSLVVFDVLGREVAALASGYHEAGYHSATWNASGQASGVYFARLSVTNAEGAATYTRVNKLMLVR